MTIDHVSSEYINLTFILLRLSPSWLSCSINSIFYFHQKFIFKYCRKTRTKRIDNLSCHTGSLLSHLCHFYSQIENKPDRGPDRRLYTISLPGRFPHSSRIRNETIALCKNVLIMVILRKKCQQRKSVNPIAR